MTKKEEDKKIVTDDDFATDEDEKKDEEELYLDDSVDEGPITGGHGITNDEKEEMLKQVLVNAGYDYEPKPRNDGDEIWTPCGQDIPKESKPMSKETKDKILKAKRSNRLKGFLDEE